MRDLSYLDDFIKVFSGNRDFYLEHVIDLDVETKKGKKHQAEAFFKNQELKDSVYMRHITGSRGLGVCPVYDTDKALFGCIDIDNYSKSTKLLVQARYDLELPLFPCKSKSGGLHIYFFVRKAVKAKSLIDALEEVVKILGIDKTFGEGNVEIFPKQTKLASGTKGNTITIPYFNAENPVSWLWSQTLEPVTASAAVDKIKKGRTTIAALADALDNVPYDDAPCCIQTVLLSSALGKDSGRNNFLFTCSVYLKKKYGDSFKKYLEEFNDKLAYPVTEQELESIYSSVVSNEYNYKCKDVPCKVYCNKIECAKREFGVGKDKGYFSGIDYGTLTRMKAEEPYYIWKLKHVDSEEYKDITFKDEQALLDQKFFARMCVRYLNHAPFRVKDNEWFKILNTVMDTALEECEVEKETDTSDRAEVRDAFKKFLAQQQTTRNLPVQVKLGFVHKNCTKYFFTHRGFEQFLDLEKIKVNRDDTLRELLLLFGAESDTLEYHTSSGAEVKLPCWSKKTDDEVQEIEDYYSDVWEADEDLLQLAKEAELEDSDEDLF